MAWASQLGPATAASIAFQSGHLAGPPRRPAHLLVVRIARSCSADRQLIERNPGIADLLIDLEADDDLRAKLEIELLSGASGGEAS